MIKRLIGKILKRRPGASAVAKDPVIVPRDQHGISRKNLSPNALKVLYRLRDQGYDAYLVGGCIRDLLLGLQPKDFDVATNASPDDVRGTFRNCRLVGRRFRLAHILFGREVIEVATFRANHNPDTAVDDSGRVLRDNVFGTIEDDAIRRDFSINALYYDVGQFAVIDYVGGMQDIEARQIRLLGDPETRYREDPVRALRACRFAAKLGFDIEAATAAPLAQTGALLGDIPPARLFEEVLKLFQSGHAVSSLARLREHGLLRFVFPSVDARLQANDAVATALFERALQNTDLRVREDKPITPAFLYAALLWPDVQAAYTALIASASLPPIPAMHQATDDVLAKQLRITALPKRFSAVVREIWTLQPRLERYKGKRAVKAMESARFRAGYDLLCLRADAGEPLADLATWWTDMQQGEDAERARQVREETAAEQRREGRRQSRRGGRRRGGNNRRRGGGRAGAAG
ncbi:MAG: polynucleotide adenylyltransferase PcnB [Pseudomonadota bacterium]